MGYARYLYTGLALAMGLVLAGAGALAGEADVVGVEAKAESGGTWRFDVSVAHGDTGWGHYAHKWDVIGAGGGGRARGRGRARAAAAGRAPALPTLPLPLLLVYFFFLGGALYFVRGGPTIA